MDIINESEFSKEELAKITLKSTRLGGKAYWIYLISTIAVMIATLVIMIIMINQKKKYGDLIAIEGCFLIIVLILLYFKLIYPKTIKKQYQKVFGDTIHFKYTFHINRFDCEATSDNHHSKATFPFDKLYKIIDKNGIMRIYIEKRNFFPVIKGNFNSDDYKKLDQILAESKVRYIKK